MKIGALTADSAGRIKLQDKAVTLWSIPRLTPTRRDALLRLRNSLQAQPMKNQLQLDIIRLSLTHRADIYRALTSHWFEEGRKRALQKQSRGT